MEPESVLTGRLRPLFLASLLLGFLVLTIAPKPEAQASGGDQSRRCHKVVVSFKPEGGGGAIAVRTKYVRCFRARKIIRRCIKGNLTSGWRGKFVSNRLVLRKKRRRISYLPVGGGGCIPVQSLKFDRGSSQGPRLAPGANRLRIFRANLDRDRRKEKILVYNRPSGQSPVTWFETRDRRGGRWVLVQRRRVSVSAGAASSGLRKAWVGDLNRDGRVEIAVRDSITPSVGEVLSLFRQRRNRARFSKLQGIGGDRVRVVRRSGRTATLVVVRTSGHSPDGREHRERWNWSGQFREWRCTSDCVSF